MQKLFGIVLFMWFFSLASSANGALIMDLVSVTYGNNHMVSVLFDETEYDPGLVTFDRFDGSIDVGIQDLDGSYTYFWHDFFTLSLEVREDEVELLSIWGAAGDELDALTMIYRETEITEAGYAIVEFAVVDVDIRFHDANPVPEPATMLLMSTGLVGLAGFRKKFKK